MEGILGQDAAKGLLVSAVASGRAPHAYVFHGPLGVGKFTTAVAFAKLLLCLQKHDQPGRACGVCPACRLIGGGEGKADRHPDLHVVTKELARYSDEPEVRNRKLTSIPVQVLRWALIEPAHRAAQLGSGKVFIVDEAHLLGVVGQNLLLKTLEEPPAGTYIILITPSLQPLLPTVLSRSRQVPFTILPDEVLVAWLDRIHPRNDSPITDRDRSWLIGFAGGSLGRAALAMDYGLLDWAHVVLPALDRMADRQPTPDLGEQIAQMINTFAKQWVERHEQASKEAANRFAAELMGAMIQQHARERLTELAQRCPSGSPADSEAVLNPWLGVIDAVALTERELADHVNLGLVTDHLASRLDRSLTSSLS